MGGSKLCNITNDGLDIIFNDKDLMEFKIYGNELEICNYSTQIAAISVKVSQTCMIQCYITDSVFLHLHDKLIIFINSSSNYEDKIKFDNSLLY